MAHIVFASAAYLGDVAPFVAPANRLVDRGHRVTFLTPRGFHAYLNGERFDLATYSLDFSPAGMRADPAHERLLRHPFVNQGRLARYWMRRGFVADPASGRADLLRKFAGADLLVTHPTFGAATIPAALHLDIPVVVGQLFPMMMPTAQWTPPLPDRNRNAGPRLNRRSWPAFAAISGALMYDRTMNRYRRSLGVERLRGTALLSWTAAVRTVVLVSRHYFGEEPDDWSDWKLEGFSAWTGPAGQATDPAVDDFVTSGPPPVLVCLGTSAAAGAASTFATIAHDLQAKDLRPLLLVGDPAHLQSLHDMPGAFAFAPVPSLAGRCAAAVVSGALGTLAAVLAAGIPVVVLPQLFDQVWHAKRVQDLGVGMMVRRPSQVAGAVAKVLADPGFQQRAAALGARLREEDGAAALVEAVELTL